MPGWDGRTYRTSGFLPFLTSIIKIVMDGGVLKGFVFIDEIHHEGVYWNLLLWRIEVAFFTNAILKGTFAYSLFQRRAMRM